MCILLVEDEELIRDILVEELGSQGLEVCEAHNGDHAAVLIENPPKPFRLLITDIHMPGQRNGIEVARLMRLRHPSLPVIYTTGRPDILDTLDPLGPMEAVILKPFDLSALANVVWQLLTAPTAPRRAQRPVPK